MRVFLCAVLLWIVQIPLTMPPIALAQTQTQSQTQSGGNVNVQRPSFGDLLLKELSKQLSPKGTVHVPSPGTKTPPPRGPEASGGDDVKAPPPSDTEGPVIRVSEPDVTAEKGSATIKAYITDKGGQVARAVLRGPNGEVEMRPNGAREFIGSYKLAPNYQKTPLTVRAWDASGNVSRPYSVSMRRLPVCGNPAGITVSIARNVQRSLNSLGGYGLGLDGIAGGKTCDAIKDAGFTHPFDWPWLDDKLKVLIGIAQISLEIDAPAEITEEIVPIRVSVIDPQKTGVVRWVSMKVPDAADQSLPNLQKVLTFHLKMKEGERRRVTFATHGKVGRRPYAEQSVDLYRLPKLGLQLSAADLVAGKITTEEEEVIVQVKLTGATSGKVFYQINGQDNIQSRNYSGGPVAIRLKLPQSGAVDELAFQGRSGKRITEPVFIRLTRIKSTAPTVSVIDPVLGLVPEADPWPPYLSASASSPTGWSPVPMVEPASLTDPAPLKPAPLPPPPLPSWIDTLRPLLIPLGIGVVLILGVVGGTVSLIRRVPKADQPVVPAVPPTLRVVAVPDPKPVVEVPGANLPGLMLTVEPDAHGTAEVEYEETLERVAS